MNIRSVLSAFTLSILLTACRTASPLPVVPPEGLDRHRTATPSVPLKLRIQAELGKDFFQKSKCQVQKSVTIYGRNVTENSGRIHAHGPFVALIHSARPASSIILVWSSSPSAAFRFEEEGEDPVMDIRGGSGLHSLQGEETRPWAGYIKTSRS